MAGDLSLREPITRRQGEAASRATAGWLVPPVVVPIFLAVAVVAYALYRFAHLGPAAFG
jgi:hypothetical protein